MNEPQRWWVREVHNFGGFFGGDTVTLSATPASTLAVAVDASDDETTLVIDEKALQNVADRHMIAPEMLLEVRMAGERVDHATLVATREWAVLFDALGTTRGVFAPAGPLTAPQFAAYHCATCELWVGGAPSNEQCAVCGAAVEV